MRDALCAGREQFTRVHVDAGGVALRPVLFGRAERGGGRHLIAATHAAFRAQTLAESRNPRVALRLFRVRAIHPCVRTFNLRCGRKLVFVRRCLVRVSGCFRRRRARLCEAGAATVVLVGRRKRGDGAGRARFVCAASVDDGGERTAPHARREREKQAEDESRSSHNCWNFSLPRLSLTVAVNLTWILSGALICSDSKSRSSPSKLKDARQSSTINLPRTMFMPQLKVNVPARAGVNSMRVVLKAGNMRLICKSPKITCSVQEFVSSR